MECAPCLLAIMPFALEGLLTAGCMFGAPGLHMVAFELSAWGWDSGVLDRKFGTDLTHADP